LAASGLRCGHVRPIVHHAAGPCRDTCGGSGPVDWRLRPDEAAGNIEWQHELLRQTGHVIAGRVAMNERWTIDTTPESAEGCGQALTRSLTAELPNLTGLLDRDAFLRRLRGEQPPPVRASTAAQVALLLDDGMTDELAALLADLDEAERAMAVDGSDRRSPFVVWAEQWIRDRR
jgi:hypothetical protein